MKKSTATITFHAAHNYGSMLQAYALQQTLLSLGVDNEIINFRTERQKNFYPNPFELHNVGWARKLKFFILDHLLSGYKDSLLKKYLLFEEFLRNKLILTKEFSSTEDLKKNLQKFDYYITGSDQCWNTSCGDFDWSYYLNFTDSLNKISYASSFGLKAPDKKILQIKEQLSKFKFISAREKGSADYIENIIGKFIAIMPDPTLILPRDHWAQLAGDASLMNDSYIFVYTPFARAGTVEIAIHLSNLTGLPIVISNEPASKDLVKLLIKKNIRFKLDAGPVEFLNLIKNASYVVSGSFHAVVFSLIFHRPFIAVDGLQDNRMKELLYKYRCEDMAVMIEKDGKFILEAPPGDIPYGVDNSIAEERRRALEYLENVLEIK